MHSMPRIPILLLLLIVSLTLTARAADPGEDLLAAAKKGDADTVQALLGKGVDVNFKNSYGATALSFAADKGHLAVVKLLLQHKADVNAKDTFYKSSPLDWAVSRNYVDIVKALVEAGAEDAGKALRSAAAKGDVKFVAAILDGAKLNETVLNEQALTKALAATPAKHAAVAELLTKAGAKPPAIPEVTVDRDVLAAYAGTYRSDEGSELTIAIEEGKFTARGVAGPASPLTAIDSDSFQNPDGTSTLTFRREGDMVTSLISKRDTSEMIFRRVESSNKPAPVAAAIDDPGGVVTSPLNWPSFRGPRASGIADGQFPPLVWDATKDLNIRWKTPIPGLGHSCPIVWDDRVYLTTAVSSAGKAELRTGLYGDVDSVNESAEHSWRVYCLDKSTGEILWERTACTGVPKIKRHPKASHANPTPATDGVHVVASFGSEGLYCYDRDGKLLWQKSLGVLDSGWFFDADYQWGFGSSPILYQDRVIVQCDVGKDSFLAAYSLADGEETWRTPRDEIPSWGTPTIVETPDRVELVTNATRYARGYDPRTGEELWRLGPHSEITVPTPVFGAGLIFVSSGYRPIKPIYAIRPGATGDISLKKGETTNDAVAWSTEKGGPYMPTPIVYDNYLYTCTNAGILTCFEAQTGKQVYRERLGGGGGYTASPVAADGKLYFTSEESDVRVVRAGPKFELLASNPLGDPCVSTPAISDGMLFIRTQHYLFGIGRKPPHHEKAARADMP
ncbi:MAG: PQQ-binding-like beta-propeller repeat protein [Pirellulales bacterium]